MFQEGVSKRSSYLLRFCPEGSGSSAPDAAIKFSASMKVSLGNMCGCARFPADWLATGLALRKARDLDHFRMLDIGDYIHKPR